jgi:hypothetical protein
MPNYGNSSVYKLLKQDDYDNKNIYIGSTTNFRGRKNDHKTCCINANTKHYNLKVYQFIRDNGGWNEWTMIQLEAFPCETKKELETRERYWIEQMNPVLNCMIPARTDKEINNYNKKYHKEYRINNKEKLSEQKKEYYENNKEILKEKQQIYINTLDKNVLSEYNKTYRDNNKEKISENKTQKITCECGYISQKTSLPRHKRSQKHIKLMEEKNNIPTKTLTEYNKEYRANNIEKLVENYKIYYENNKEVILEKKQEYYENNKEKIEIRKKEYYENNKEIISENNKEKMTCECGCIFRKVALARHKKSQTHIKWMEEKNNIIE